VQRREDHDREQQPQQDEYQQPVEEDGEVVRRPAEDRQQVRREQPQADDGEPDPQQQQHAGRQGRTQWARIGWTDVAG
jgi:hypothetical protein